MEVNVYRRDGSETGRTVTLDPSVFEVTPNDHAIWLDVRSVQANARQGTHKTKERSEVAGSTRKLWRQKGTGRARAGSAKNPVWVGGGRTFGPRPRSYSVGVNRKTKQLARRSALTYKAREEALRIVENFDLSAPRTRDVADLLKAFGLAGTKVLLLTSGTSPNLYKSGRNIPKVTVREASAASTFDLLNASVVLMQEGALEGLVSVLGGSSKVEATAPDEATA